MADELDRSTRPAPRQRLRRILEELELVHMVQALPPRALAKLIDHVGLEDSGVIEFVASVAQVQAVQRWLERFGRPRQPAP